MHIDNKNKDIFILDKGSTQGSDDTTLTGEAKCPINFAESEKRLLLTLHYNGRLICSCYKNISIQGKRFRNETIPIMFR